MRKNIAYLFAASLALALVGRLFSDTNAVHAADPADLQFEDNFETLDASWGEGKEYGVKDGKFFIELAPDSALTVLNQANVFEEIDATILLTIVKVDPPEYGAAGLVFWAKDYSDYYKFMIDAAGEYHVTRLVGNRWASIIDWKPNDAIKKGLGQTNELRVVTEEHTATLYVNGVQLIHFKGQHPEGGQLIGFNADSSESKDASRYEFAELKVR